MSDHGFLHIYLMTKGGEVLKTFELSQKESKNGRREFKLILHQIYPDSCIDEANEVGTVYNKNGITWIESYCAEALPTIKGMSLRAEFLDEDRTELCGHGSTGIVDGLPVFENAVQIGTFEEGYIDDVEVNGEPIRACIGVGTIDGMCYHNFCEKLEQNIEKGEFPDCSVEILKTAGNDKIIYKYGYKEKGRIPSVFEYSGCALLGITPADETAKILEFNENLNKEEYSMNESEIKAFIEETVEKYTAHVTEMNQMKAECEQKIAEANSAVEAITAEKNELTANVAQIQAALEAARKELEEKYDELETLHEEINTLRKELGDAKAKERIGEMNAAIAQFTDEQKAFAKEEIEAFNADPINSEINSIVGKIYQELGKKSFEDNKVSEQNAANEPDVVDIFSEVLDTKTVEDTNIF